MKEGSGRRVGLSFTDMAPTVTPWGSKSPSDCWHGCHVRSHNTARKSGCNMAGPACSPLDRTIPLGYTYRWQSQCRHSFSGTVRFISPRALCGRLSSSPTFAVDCRLSGNLGLAWISATRAVGDGGAAKGDPPGAFPLAYTHLSAKDSASLPDPVLSGVWRLRASAFLSRLCAIT